MRHYQLLNGPVICLVSVVIIIASLSCGQSERGAKSESEYRNTGDRASRGHKTIDASEAIEIARDHVEDDATLTFSRPVRLPNDKFVYLEARATPKTGGRSTKFAVYRTGQLMSLSEAESHFEHLFKENWSGLSRGAADKLGELDSDELGRFTAELKKEGVQPEFGGGNVEVVRYGMKGMVQLRGTRAGIQKIARDDRVRRIYPTATESEALITQFYGPADYTNSDVTFNDDGIFGTDYTVGVIDTLYNGCVAVSDHSALEDAEISYTHSPVQCSSNSDCPSDCHQGSGYQLGVCKYQSMSNSPLSAGNYCVVSVPDDNGDGEPDAAYRHTSMVVSRIAQNHDGGSEPRHAAGATIHIYNGSGNALGADLLSPQGAAAISRSS